MSNPDALWKRFLGLAFFVGASWFVLDGHIAPLAQYHPWPMIMMGLGLALYVFFQKPLLAGLRVLFSRGRPDLLAAILFVAGTLGAATYCVVIFDRIPHSIDGIVYLFQSKVFLTGNLKLPSPALPEFFDYVFVISDGRWFMLFQPLWPLVLALGQAVGLAWLVNPVLAGLTLTLTYLLGRRTLGEAPARLGSLILLICPLFLGLSATFLNHSLSALLTVAGFYFAVRAVQDRKTRFAVAAGAAMGLLFCTRSLNAAVMSPFVLGYLAVGMARGRIRGRVVLLACLAALALGSLQLGYNRIQTGHFMYFPQDDYFNMTEPVKNCHRLGFGTGVGCPVIHADSHFPNGFTPADAVQVTHRRLGTFATTLFGWNGFFLVILAGLGLMLKGRLHRYWLFTPFLALLGGYFLFYFHGVWGRYYYCSTPFLCLLLGDSLLLLHQRAREFTRRRLTDYQALIPGLAFSLAFSLVVFTSLFLLPTFSHSMSGRFFNVDAELRRAVERQNIHNAVVLVYPEHYANAFQLLDPRLDKADVLYANDLGPHTINLVNHYPDRTFYYWAMPARRLVKLDLKPDYDRIYIQPAFKGMRTATSGEYAGFVRLNYLGINGTEPDYQGVPQLAMALWGNKPGSYFSFRHIIEKPGLYKVRTQVLAGPTHCSARLSIAGQELSARLGGYSPDLRLMQYSYPQPVALPRGEVLFTLTAAERDPLSNGCVIGMSDLVLTRVEDLPEGIPSQAPPLPPLTEALHQNVSLHASPLAMAMDIYRYWQSHQIYSELHFLLWLFLAVPLVWLAPLKGRRRQGLILALSVGFIIFLWGIKYGLGVVAVPALTYLAVDRFRQRLQTSARFRRWFLGITIGGMTATFFLLLYNEGNSFSWFFLPLLHVAGVAYMLPKLIHFMVDEARGTLGQRDFLSAMVYFTYFPTWRWGPVERYPEFRQSLTNACETHRSREDIITGFYRLGLGGMKTVLFLLVFKQYVYTYWDGYRDMTWWQTASGLYLGIFGVYLNFGGYADWAIGISRLWGIHLNENFVRPFSSPNIGEWWRRWHMTMAFWLRDYVYISLGGSRRGNVYLNYFLTFTAVGVWHSLSWNFLIWGALQGTGLAFFRGWKTFWYGVRKRDGAGGGLMFALRRLQALGDAFPRVRYGLSVMATFSYFASTGIFFIRQVDVALPVFLHAITFGLYPVN